MAVIRGKAEIRSARELFEFAENNLKTSRSHACKRRMFRYAEEIPGLSHDNFQRSFWWFLNIQIPLRIQQNSRNNSGFYFGTGKPSQNSLLLCKPTFLVINIICEHFYIISPDEKHDQYFVKLVSDPYLLYLTNKNMLKLKQVAYPVVVLVSFFLSSDAVFLSSFYAYFPFLTFATHFFP
jgi:hypothetical protein